MVFIKRIKQGKHTYLAEVKSVREGSRVRHKFIRYVGKEVDNKTVLSGSLDRAQVTKVSVYGPLLVLHDIATQLGLFEIFEEQAPYVLSLAFAHCVEPGSLVSIQRWYGRTDLQHLLGLEDVTYDKLLDALDYLQDKRKQIQKGLFQSAKNTFGLHPEGLFYDVTNIYFYGSHCELAKKGYNKDKSRREQVQIGLAVTKDEKIPLFHKVFEGNIHDAKTIRHLFDEFDIEERAWIVWDRGITSKENLIDAKKARFHVLCGLPLKGKIRKLVEGLLQSKDFTRFENRIELTKSTLYAKQMGYSYEGIPGCVTVCVNEKEKVALKESRYRKIQQAINRLKRKKPISTSIRKYVRYNNINKRAVAEAEKFDGVSLIFSTKKLPIQDTLTAYFEKDKVEKAFQSLKSTLEIRPIRHWLTERVKAHIFICYIAYYLLSILEYKLRPLNITASQALDQLKTVYRIHITDPKTKNTFIKTVTLTKEQEKILRAINKRLLNCSQ